MLEKARSDYAEARSFEKDIKKFGEMVMAEPALLEELDKTPDKESFINLYLKLAQERGLSFTKDDLLIAVQEQKQGQDWIIPRKVILMIAERF